jgi:hypothetical protein
MKLSAARLCLDCEDVHGEDRCPVCGSEIFAYLTRWISVGETTPKAQPQPVAATQPQHERVAAYRRLLVADAVRPKTGRLLKQGAVGLAAISLARWAWRRYQRWLWASPLL